MSNVIFKLGRLNSTNEYIECQFHNMFYYEMQENLINDKSNTNMLRKIYHRMLERKLNNDILIEMC